MPFEISKTVVVSAAHHLDLPYDSPCNTLHGHNYKVTVRCTADHLNVWGMVVDFVMIKGIIKRLDHAYLNDFLELGGDDTKPGGPTAERTAKWITEHLLRARESTPARFGQGFRVISVRMEETEGSVVWYRP